MHISRMSQQFTVGVDVGGTKIAGGLVNSKGRLTKDMVVPTLADKDLKTSLGQVFLLIERMVRSAGGKDNLRGIGGETARTDPDLNRRQ